MFKRSELSHGRLGFPGKTAGSVAQSVCCEPTAWMEGKRQVNILELQAGMVLAHDLVTGMGTNLLPKDSIVGISHIEKILAHHHFDQIVNSIYVYSSSMK